MQQLILGIDNTIQWVMEPYCLISSVIRHPKSGQFFEKGAKNKDSRWSYPYAQVLINKKMIKYYSYITGILNFILHTHTHACIHSHAHTHHAYAYTCNIYGIGMCVSVSVCKQWYGVFQQYTFYHFISILTWAQGKIHLEKFIQCLNLVLRAILGS